jgi:hypothetical protein
MSKSQKIFRYMWRVNAVAIFLAVALITILLGVELIGELRRSDWYVGQEVIGGENSRQSRPPSLGSFSEVTGNKGTLRAELQVQYETGGFKSGVHVETRNILFIAPGDKKARWLLPDNDHIISNFHDITETTTSKAERTLATAALVRAERSDDKAARLILFDPPGHRLLDVSEKVTDIYSSASSEGKITFLFGRNKRVVRVTVDAKSFGKLQEDEIELPVLESNTSAARR